MAGEKKKPPLKLVWFEEVTNWLEAGPQLEVTRSERTRAVSRPDVALTAAMVMRATTSKTNEALVSARWVERMTGLYHGKVSDSLDVLDTYGWVAWTQRTRNRVKYYEISIPTVRRLFPHVEPSADTSADTSAETVSHTPGTPGTPLEDFIEERAERCPNCEEPTDAHAPDCAHRPFDDSEEKSKATVPDTDAENGNQSAMLKAIERLEVELDAGWPCCDYCDRCDEEVEEMRGVFIHRACAPTSWRKAG